MAANNGTEQTTRKTADTNNREKEMHVEDNRQLGNGNRQHYDDEERGRITNSGKSGEQTQRADNTETRYGRELTVEVEVEGTEQVSMMDILTEVKKQCGHIMGCRVKGLRRFEITMKDEEGKTKLMDGVRVKGALVHARDIVNTDMVVSFINLPVYLEDDVILTRLGEWRVKPMSDIKRRKWPGTEIADGTRFLKVRFNNEVRSLPYSTKFATLSGAEYFRVIHDRQIRVCRLCIKPGHIFRECPEFKCFRCLRTGHYARECALRNGTVSEEEESPDEGGDKRRKVIEAEEQQEESDGAMDDEEADENSEVQRELEQRHGIGCEVRRGKDNEKGEMVHVERLAESEESMEEEEKDQMVSEQGRLPPSMVFGDRKYEQRNRGEGRKKESDVTSEAETVTAQRLAAKRKAEENKVQQEKIKGPRSGM